MSWFCAALFEDVRSGVERVSTLSYKRLQTCIFSTNQHDIFSGPISEEVNTIRWITLRIIENDENL